MRKISRIERLAKKEEQAIVKRIVYLFLISIVLAFLLLTFGVPLLGKVSDFIGTVLRTEETDSEDEKTSLNAPRVDSLPEATNSTRLAIFGFSDSGNKVKIFLNGEEAGETGTDGGKFRFEDLRLVEGTNEIWVKGFNDKGEGSDTSNKQVVLLDREEPKLEVEGPAEGQSFSGNNRVRVYGQADKDAQVLANGFLASTDLEGKFEVFVPVVEGENVLEIRAVDGAGNSKIETRKVHFKK